MGYGQYSAGGGLNRTKVEMVDIFEGQGYGIATSRKGGKNRLHFTTDDGRQCFTLHETVVAELSADGKTLMLADGGWHTPTTKSAWHDAIGAFKLLVSNRTFRADEWATETGRGELGPDGVTRGWWHDDYVRIGFPGRDERRVSYVRGDVLNTWVRSADAGQDFPMLRADTDDGNFAVRYDGKHLRSDAGAEHRLKPAHVLAILYRADDLARAVNGRICMRGDAMWGFSFKFLDYTVHPGQTSRQLMVGCHTFRTMDVRSFMRAIEARWPDAVKPAKVAHRAWRKTAGPDPFGIKASDKRVADHYAAQRAARAAA